MFEDLKKNLDQEKKILANMRSVQFNMQNDIANKKAYDANLEGLMRQLAMLNNAIPELLKEGHPAINPTNIMPNKNVPAHKVSPSAVVKKTVKPTVKMSYVSPVTKEKRYVTVNKSDKKEFLKRLKLSEISISKIDKEIKKDYESSSQKPSSFARFSNKFFRKYSERLVPQFSGLGKDLKKANIRFLLWQYQPFYL